MMKEYLKLQDILPRIKYEVTGGTLANWARTGKIDARKEGKNNMYCLEDVLRVIEKNPKKPKGEKKLQGIPEIPLPREDIKDQPKKKRRRKKKPKRTGMYPVPEWDKDLASNLWLPTNDLIQKVNLDDKTLKHSWFKVTKANYLPEYIPGLPEIYRTPEDPAKKKETKPMSKEEEKEPLENNPGKKKRTKKSKDPRIRTITYRIYPDETQKKTLSRWFEGIRWVYNQCILKNQENPKITHTELDQQLINNDAKLPPGIHELILGDESKDEGDPDRQRIPHDVLNTAVKDFLLAREQVKKLRAKTEWYIKNNPDKKPRVYTIKPRTIKHICSFSIRHRDIKILPGLINPTGVKPNGRLYDVGSSGERELTIFRDKLPEIHNYPHRIRFYPTSFGDNGMGINQKMDKPSYGCRLSWNGKDVFMLHVPRIPPNPIKVPKSGVCSIDPGERIFASVYGTDGSTFFIGDNESQKVDRLAITAQRMRDGIKRKFKGYDEFGCSIKSYYKVTKENTKNPGRTCKRLRNKAKQLEERAKHLITDIHRKIVRFLSERYETIIIPKFNPRRICQKKDSTGKYVRNISKGTSRRLLRWSHYKFRQLLLAKCGTRVIVGTEEYTSKTCGNCFNIHWKLGDSKVFKCPTCKFSIHRDLNAARNIMLLNWAKA